MSKENNCHTFVHRDKKPCFLVYKSMANDMRISHEARSVLILIFSMLDDSDGILLENVADRVGCDQDTINIIVKELFDKGYGYAKDNGQLYFNEEPGEIVDPLFWLYGGNSQK